MYPKWISKLQAVRILLVFHIYCKPVRSDSRQTYNIW